MYDQFLKNAEYPTGLGMGIFQNDQRELVGLLRFTTKKGNRTFVLHRAEVDMLMQNLTNFIDIDEGRPPSYPEKGGQWFPGAKPSDR